MIYDRKFTMLFNLLIISMANMHTHKIFLKNLSELSKNGMFTLPEKRTCGRYPDGRNALSRTFMASMSHRRCVFLRIFQILTERNTAS